jgi:hypothetical protein
MTDKTSTLTEQELETLAEVAKAATPGPWSNGVRGSGPDGDAHMCRVMARREGGGEQLALTWHQDHIVSYVGLTRQQCVDNAEHIAAFNPETALRLLATLTAERERADHAERILRETSELLGDAGVPGGTTIAGGVIFLRERAYRAESHANAAETQAGIDRVLRRASEAENARLRAALESIVREITDENANDRNALGSCIEVVRIAKEALTPPPRQERRDEPPRRAPTTGERLIETWRERQETREAEAEYGRAAELRLCSHELTLALLTAEGPVNTMTDNRPASVRLKEKVDDLRNKSGLKDLKFWYAGGNGSEASAEVLAEEVLEIIDVYENKKYELIDTGEL